MADFNPFGGMEGFDLGKIFGGDIFSSFTKWVDSLTRMSDIDLVGVMTVGLAVIIVFVSLYGAMKEWQAGQKRMITG